MYPYKITYETARTMNTPKSLPRKIMVLETGLVTRGTMLPLSNSLEKVFTLVTIAKSTKTKPEPPNVIAYVGLAVILTH